MYPIGDATEPLLAGAVFGDVSGDKGSWKAAVQSPSQDVKILNPSILKSAPEAAKSISQIIADLKHVPRTSLIKDAKVHLAGGATGTVEVSLNVAGNLSNGMVAVLLAQGGKSEAKVPLKVSGRVDGQDTPVSTEFQEGKSQWYKVAVRPGNHVVALSIRPAKDSLSWQGKATAWFIAQELQATKTFEVAVKSESNDRVLPPTVWPAGEVRKNIKLGELEIPIIE